MRNPLGLLVLAAIFVPLERLFPARPQKVLRAGWRTDLLHFFVSHALQQGLTVLLFGLLFFALDPLVSRRVQQAVEAQPTALQVVEVVLLAELLGYAAHRLSHRVPWLWRFHAVHHSSEQLDWLSATRVHPVDTLLTRGLHFVPVVLLGFPVKVLGGAVVLLGLWAVFLHANVRFTFGPLRWVVATPEFHHWHHAKDETAHDANYAGLFPWIDAIFGTLHLPRERPRALGVEPPVPQGYWAQLTSPLRPPPATDGGAAPS